MTMTDRPSTKLRRVIAILGAAVIVAGVFAALAAFGTQKIAGEPVGLFTEVGTSEDDAIYGDPGVGPQRYDEPARTLTIDDFDVSLKTTEKSCYGGAGCVITVEPKLGWSGDADGYDVTVSIMGSTDGEVITTMTIDGDEYLVMPQVLMTEKRSDILSVSVISVTP